MMNHQNKSTGPATAAPAFRAHYTATFKYGVTDGSGTTLWFKSTLDAAQFARELLDEGFFAGCKGWNLWNIATNTERQRCADIAWSAREGGYNTAVAIHDAIQGGK